MFENLSDSERYAVRYLNSNTDKETFQNIVNEYNKNSGTIHPLYKVFVEQMAEAKGYTKKRDKKTGYIIFEAPKPKKEKIQIPVEKIIKIIPINLSNHDRRAYRSYDTSTKRSIRGFINTLFPKNEPVKEISLEDTILVPIELSKDERRARMGLNKIEETKGLKKLFKTIFPKIK